MVKKLIYRIPHDRKCLRRGEWVSLVDEVMETLRTCDPPIKDYGKRWVVKTVVIEAEIRHLSVLERAFFFTRMASEADEYRC